MDSTSRRCISFIQLVYKYYGKEIMVHIPTNQIGMFEGQQVSPFFFPSLFHFFCLSSRFPSTKVSFLFFKFHCFVLFSLSGSIFLLFSFFYRFMFLFFLFLSLDFSLLPFESFISYFLTVFFKRGDMCYDVRKIAGLEPIVCIQKAGETIFGIKTERQINFLENN